ncbi:MAG: hypothetical protein HY961_17880 [Ignavibacteriae bacterium]|nr:hypothetical protein [Ignavibacteriota bacterium]
MITQTIHHTKKKEEIITKRTLMTFGLAAVLALVGCSKKSDNPVTPGTINNGGNEQVNVNFTMHLESGTQGMIFIASPSEDVRLTKVELSFPAQSFRDTINNPNPTAVIAKNSNIQINEYTGIEGGQQWVLVFYGTLASTGKPFTKTINWTVV